MILGKLLNPKKQVCDGCHEKFHHYADLVTHVKLKHHGPVTRCPSCGEEFVRESDRYHHLQEEKAKKLDSRRHR
jgi:predicted amidophosphoribosyltransferase